MAEGSGEVVAVPATGAVNGLNNGAGGTSAQTNNPLSRKLRKILDTRLDNDKVSGAGGVEGAASSAGRTRAGGGVCPAPSGSSLIPAAERTPGPRDPLRCRRGAGEKGEAEEPLEERRGFLGVAPYLTVLRRLWIGKANGEVPCPRRCSGV